MTDSKPKSGNGHIIPRNPFHIVNMTAEFFRLEAAGGILLVLASVMALIVANGPFYELYEYVLNGVNFRIGFSDPQGYDFQINKSILHWINDGMMAIFFLLVGLEIKRELIIGELQTRSKAALPVLAAIGGMVVPAAIYAFVNRASPQTIDGWAISCATDIAFALGVLSILGNRVPMTLKVLLTAVAIIDDLGAIVIIALFYSDSLHLYALLFALLPILAMFFMNRAGFPRRAAYIVLGIILWLAVLKSGVHATMAGVITAFFIPLRAKDPEDRRSPAQRLENDLHPWVVFLILPLFGFANAGVPFTGMGLHSFMDPVTLGIILGLVVGKQVGVFGGAWLAIKSGICAKPEGVCWRQMYGMAVLCGIGFTMSLFIGGLAFTGTELQAEVRLGVLGGSFISAIAGYILLRSTGKKV